MATSEMNLTSNPKSTKLSYSGAWTEGSKGSTPSYIFNYGETEEEEYDDTAYIDLMSDVYSSDDADDDYPTLYAQQEDTEQQFADFFEFIGNIPDIDDLSRDDKTSIEGEIAEEEGEEEQEESSDGVTPRQRLPSRGGELSKSLLEVKEMHYEPCDIVIDDGDDFKDMPVDDESFKEGKKIESEDDALEMFLELEAEQIALTAQPDWQTLAKMRAEEQMQSLRRKTYNFLCDLIDNVVTKIEVKTPEQILHKNLDKHQLMHELYMKYHELQEEKHYCSYLNRRVVDYYHRKKLRQFLVPDTAKNLHAEKAKYQEALKRLDKWLAKESFEVASCKEKLEEFEKKYDIGAKRAEAEVQQFEELMKETLIKSNRPNLNAYVEQQIIQMAKCRKELSDIRFEYFKKQDNQAKLLSKLASLEDLGNGYTLKTYGILMTECHALTKKIEGISNELSKLHINRHEDIHIVAHYKEKKVMMRNLVAVQRMALEELSDQCRMWREKIYQLSKERERIRQQIQDLRYKGGLVDNPLLLHDYDRTVEEVKEKQEQIDKLKETHRELQEKIDGAEE